MEFFDKKDTKYTRRTEQRMTILYRFLPEYIVRTVGNMFSQQKFEFLGLPIGRIKKIGHSRNIDGVLSKFTRFEN